MTHSGVIHFIAENDEEALSYLPPPAELPAPEQPGRPAPRAVRGARRSQPGAERRRSRRSEAGLRRARRDRRVVDRGDFLEVQAGFAMNIVVGFARILGRPIGIIANQPRCSPACSTSTPRQGRPLHPVLQRLQHPAGDVRRRAGLPAGRAAGVRRHHPPRREDAVRLLGGDGAEDPADPAQGVRRSVPGDVRQGPGCRPRRGLADGRDRRHGRRRGRRDRLPQGDG